MAREYQVKFVLFGTTPLLMHRDDVEAADALKEWRMDPANKNISVPGDDRSPPWTWQTYLYTDGEHLAMPSDNLMAALRIAGTQMILKRQKTFKEITQSGLFVSTEFCDFFNNGKKVTCKSITVLRNKLFSEQADGARALGFRLFVKRALLQGKSKHVRVRARFDDWSVQGTLRVLRPDEIPFDVLKSIFEIAGRGGLCDWRPSSKTPGPWGMFTAKLTLI